jgi:alkylhydroperoxidase family enzyme
MSSRIAPAEPPYPADIRAAMDQLPPLVLFRTLARNPRVFSRFVASNLLDQGSITVREREIVIDRTCVRCRSEYEWAVHLNFFAKRAELTPNQILAIVHGGSDDPTWNVREGLLIALVDALHDHADIDDDLWRRLKTEFSDEQMLELIVLTGFYHMVSFATNALRLPLEPGTPRWNTSG